MAINKTIITLLLLACSFCHGQVLNPPPVVFSNLPADTIKCIMLVSDTSYPGHMPVYTLRGFTVGPLYDQDFVNLKGHEVPGFISPHYFLDEKKKRLNSRLIVWKAANLY